MTIIFDGTQGITTPAETANNSVTTPVVKSGSALTLQTNGSTTAVTIDTSQRVGIGITNPSASLDVKTNISITENSVASSNTELTLLSRFSDNQRGYVILKAESNSSGSSDLVVRSRNNFSEAEKFRIDSVGRVTTPAQPRFSGGLVGNSGNVFANPLVFNSALLNQGSCYNTSTGLFTCPVAGVYRVSCSTTTFINGYAAVNITLRKNGSDIDVAYGKGYWEGSLSSSYLGKTASWLISCAANDNLAVGGTAYREPTASYSTLTIELVG